MLSRRWWFPTVLPIVIAAAVLAVGCGAPAESRDRRVASTGDRLPVRAASVPSEPFPDGAAVRVDVTGMAFQPQEVRISAGQSVTWRFDDSGVVHSVTAFNGAFDSGLKSSGDFTVRFDTPGTYCYQCLPHPGRNLCAQGRDGATGMPPLLFADPLRLAPPLFAGGGGHMQGKIVVEP